MLGSRMRYYEVEWALEFITRAVLSSEPLIYIKSMPLVFEIVPRLNYTLYYQILLNSVAIHGVQNLQTHVIKLMPLIQCGC
jgi:hypothetical protein